VYYWVVVQKFLGRSLKGQRQTFPTAWVGLKGGASAIGVLAS
jgi:hypothetical protein